MNHCQHEQPTRCVIQWDFFLRARWGQLQAQKWSSWGEVCEDGGYCRPCRLCLCSCCSGARFLDIFYWLQLEQKINRIKMIFHHMEGSFVPTSSWGWWCSVFSAVFGNPNTRPWCRCCKVLVWLWNHWELVETGETGSNLAPGPKITLACEELNAITIFFPPICKRKNVGACLAGDRGNNEKTPPHPTWKDFDIHAVLWMLRRPTSSGARAKPLQK